VLGGDAPDVAVIQEACERFQGAQRQAMCYIYWKKHAPLNMEMMEFLV